MNYIKYKVLEAFVNNEKHVVPENWTHPSINHYVNKVTLGGILYEQTIMLNERRVKYLIEGDNKTWTHVFREVYEEDYIRNQGGNKNE